MAPDAAQTPRPQRRLMASFNWRDLSAHACVACDDAEHPGKQIVVVFLPPSAQAPPPHWDEQFGDGTD